MRHPHLRRADLVQRRAQLVPVGSGRRSPAAAPPRCRARWRTRIQPDARHVTGSASRRAQRSAIADGGASTMAPASSAFAATVAGRRSPSGTPSARRRAQRQQRAVQVDRPVPAGLAQQRDQPLALAQRVAADDVGALREQRHAVQQPADLARAGGWRNTGSPKVASVTNTSQAIGSNGGRWDRARACSRRHHGAAAAPLHRHLRAAQHVAGRLQPHADLADRSASRRRPAPAACAGPALPHAHVHDRQRLGAGQHRAVAGPGMVGMGVGDDGALHRAHRIDDRSRPARSTARRAGPSARCRDAASHCTTTRRGLRLQDTGDGTATGCAPTRSIRHGYGRSGAVKQ